MNMTGAKIALLGAAAIGAIDVSKVAGSWEDYSLVGLLIVAVVAIYRDGNKRQDRLEAIIERNSTVTAEATSTLKTQNALIVETKEIVMTCPGRTLKEQAADFRQKHGG